MATTQVSLEEYLRTHYEPDCDYVDGELEERNTGELEHFDNAGVPCRVVCSAGRAMEVRTLPSAPVPGLADPGACSGYRHPSDQDSL